MADPDVQEYETVLYDVDDRVAVVTLNRPEVHNALSFQLRTDIVAAVRRAEQDPDVSLVLLKGAGKSFCAGYDLKVTGDVDGAAQPRGLGRRSAPRGLDRSVLARVHP